MRGLAVALLLGLCAAALPAANAASPGPAEVVDAFHAALKAGHADAAAQMLTQDVYIAEQGFVETGRAAYVKAQAENDVKFAQATRLDVVNRHIIWLGPNAACVISQTHRTGSFAGHDINLVGAETALLRKFGDHWQIAHVHWSAHEVQPADGAAH